MLLRKNRLFMAFIFIFIALAAVSFSSAVTLVYHEGDLVKVVSEAEDIDGDEISFVYSSPLNQSGEWQTGYDDAGTYKTTVSAFDGKDYTEEEITLVVHNVNRPPLVAVEDADADENDIVDVQPRVSDPDGDSVTVTFSPPLDNNGRWQTTFDDAGTHQATVVVSDGQDQVEETFAIIVEDKNRAPSIITALPDDGGMLIRETEEVSFFAEAKDPDGDSLAYSWFVDDEEKGDGEEFTYVSDYDDAGDHVVAVEASDGKEKARTTWPVEVQNVNRAPSLPQLEDASIDENETLVLELPQEDIDGDEITYTIDEPIGNDGRWRTGYDDAGVYTITIVAHDGELSVKETIVVTVNDVDRAPELNEVDDLTINENEELYVPLSAADPDADEIIFSVVGLEGARIENQEVRWNAGYEFIQLPNNFFARLLSRLRIDSFFYKPQKTLDVLLNACGKEKCANQSFTVIVQNVNRAPVMDTLDDLIIDEGSQIVIEPRGSDPDNDYVRFRFSEPVGFSGKWKTVFDDAGHYSVSVTASDGKLDVVQNVSIIVENVNRLPTFGKISDNSVLENETLYFEVPVSDADGDNLTLIAEDLPQGSEFNSGIFTWTPNYDTVVLGDDGKKEFLLTFAVSDGLEITANESTIIKKMAMITVEDTNRPPVIRSFAPN